jgi:hypothetical protein
VTAAALEEYLLGIPDEARSTVRALDGAVRAAYADFDRAEVDATAVGGHVREALAKREQFLANAERVAADARARAKAR